MYLYLCACVYNMVASPHNIYNTPRVFLVMFFRYGSYCCYCCCSKSNGPQLYTCILDRGTNIRLLLLCGSIWSLHRLFASFDQQTGICHAKVLRFRLLVGLYTYTLCTHHPTENRTLYPKFHIHFSN